jgi:hypothetical protein
MGLPWRYALDVWAPDPATVIPGLDPGTHGRRGVPGW